MEEKKTCFVVTPIGDENTAIRRHIDGIIDQAIIPAIGEEFQVKVAHREYEIGSINDRVIQSVYNSDLVIANLTGLNPNVMFEIAIRYSFGKPAIVIAEKGTKLPFDIVDENTIFYINDPAGAAELKKIIINFVKKIDWTKCEYGPVFSAIKNAAVINHIETTILEKENQNAFAFLVNKLSDLESEIKGLREAEYDSDYDDLKLIIDTADFIHLLRKKINNLSREDLEIMIRKYLYEKSIKLKKNDTYDVKKLLVTMTENDVSMPNRLKENILELLDQM